MGKDTYYFPHDFNARNDPKLIALRNKFKAVGISIYWTVIEFLHEQEGNKFDPKNYIVSTLAEQSGTSPQQVKDVLKSCVDELDLLRIDGGLYVSDRVLRNIQVRNEISAIRSVSGKKGGLSKANAKHLPEVAKQTEANAKQNVANKGKETKEKKERGVAPTHIFTPPTIPELHTAFLAKGLTDKVALLESNKFWSHFDSNGWKVGGKTKMKSWQSAVSSWYHKMDDFKKQNNQSDQPVEVRDGN